MPEWDGRAALLWNRYYLFNTNAHLTHAIFIGLCLIAVFIILNFVRICVELAIIYLASFLPGDARSWKASWTVGVAIFVISCYCLNACVETKRTQVPRANISDPPTRKNK